MAKINDKSIKYFNEVIEPKVEKKTCSIKENYCNRPTKRI